ncbi:GTP+cyclohydrolase-2 [Methylocapsa aurea]
MDRCDGGAIALPVLDIARAQGLAFNPAARLDAPVGPIGPLEESALELMRLAQVLPAAIVARNDGAKPIFPNLLGVARDDVQSFSITRLAALLIVSRARSARRRAGVRIHRVPRRRGTSRSGRDRYRLSRLLGAVRLHSACLTGDLFGSLKCDCGDQLRYATRHMAENGGGVLLYLDQEGRGNGLPNKIRA